VKLLIPNVVFLGLTAALLQYEAKAIAYEFVDLAAAAYWQEKIEKSHCCNVFRSLVFKNSWL